MSRQFWSRNPELLAIPACLLFAGAGLFGLSGLADLSRAQTVFQQQSCLLYLAVAGLLLCAALLCALLSAILTLLARVAEADTRLRNDLDAAAHAVLRRLPPPAPPAAPGARRVS